MAEACAYQSSASYRNQWVFYCEMEVVHDLKPNLVRTCNVHSISSVCVCLTQ